jgi:hypothetical protein
MVTMQPQAITKVSISALVISLPIIYVSLLRVPPSTLARDSTFWFLMSNSIIAIIAADSGMLFLGSASHHHQDEDFSDVVPSEQPAATVREDYYGDATSVPLMASSHEPTAPADMSDVVVAGGEQLLPTGGAVTVQEDYYRDALSPPLMASFHEPTAPVDMSCVLVGGGEELPTSGLVRSKAADTGGMEMEEEGHALSLIQGEGAPSNPSTDMVDQEEAPELELVSANKDDKMIVEGEHYTISPAPLMTVTPDDHAQQDEGSVQVVREEVKPQWCSVTEENKPPLEKERDYWQLSDDELNKKVEEFITRFNRDMIEQEAAAV